VYRKIHSNLRPTTLPGQTATDPYYTPLELFNIIGPSTRNCFRLQFIKKTGNPKIDIEYGDPRAVFKNAGVLLEVLQEGYAPASEQGDDFRDFFFCTNLEENPSQYKPRFHYDIPTEYLGSRIVTYFRKKEKKE
jgi:hypothetical protein